MFKPELPPLKTRIISYIAAVPIAFFIGLFYGLSPLVSAVVAAAFAVLFAAALFFELRSKRRDEEFRKAVQSGEYQQDDKWQQKYKEYILKNDFQQVRGDSMKRDLDRRYISKFGIAMLIAAAAFFIAAIFWRTGFAEINFTLAISGIIFGGWGAYKLRKTPVRAFIKQCGERLPVIERSYLNGRMLTYRRNGEGSCNNGINIGGNYTVIYSADSITAIDNSDIESVTKHVTKTKYYNNHIYSGAVFSHKLYIALKAREGELTGRQYSVELNEFQVQMAYEALSPYNTPVTASVREHTEVG